MKGVIFVAGVYGVGKSTLCEKLSKELSIPFYSSGEQLQPICFDFCSYPLQLYLLHIIRR